MGNGANKIFLHPGDFAFASDGSHLHTLLGSCVAITLWHPGRRMGGMCHFTLPRAPRSRDRGESPDGRYADGALALFRRATGEQGTALTEYQAKIFGGGNMMRRAGEDLEDSIGTKNAGAAMELLMREGVEILVAHVGEFGHRRIVFDTATGEVWVRHQAPGGERLTALCGRA